MKLNANRYFDWGDWVVITTWAVVLVATFSVFGDAIHQLVVPATTVFVLFVCYLFCFLFHSRPDEAFNPSIDLKLIAYGLQLVFAYALLYVLELDFLSILSIVWVGTFPAKSFPKRFYAVTMVQVTCWFLVMSLLKERAMWISAALWGSFHLFAVYALSQSKREQQAREALQAKHQELKATQQLLAEASKQSERTRIARDLHDLVGHHLTALTINLQIANRLTSGDAQLQIQKSEQIARLLLADVREAVSTLRENQSFDLRAAIDILVEETPKLTLELDIEQDLTIEQLSVAQTILRCIQEAITNTLKHTDSTVMYISIVQNDQKINLTISDNGRVEKNWQVGNGLAGMRERVEDCHGELHLSDEHGSLQYAVQLPAI